ncbi:MAG: tetratricopeptide repeat protein [Acidobacteriota bacterium]
MIHCKNSLYPLLLIVCMLLLPACATTPKDPMNRYTVEQLKEIGEKFYAAGEMVQALKYLTKGEQKDPKNPVIQYDLGLAFSARGLQAEALAHFQKAVTLKPDYSEAFNALGAFYAEQGRQDLAREAFLKALANPFYGTPQYARYNLGKLNEAAGDLDEALKNYKEAVRLSPSYGLAYYRMGLVYESQKLGDEARRAYGKAIEATPNLPDAHLRYGVMSYTAGEIEKALYSLTQVVKLAPNTTMADEARLYLDRMKNILPSSPKEGSVHSGGFEVMADREVIETQQPGAFPPPSAPSTPTENAQPGLTIETPAPPPVQQWNYIVQLGSFLDKANADSILSKLQAKGYSAVVKTHKHSVLGQVYVIQLKAVTTLSKATTIMTQLQDQVEGDPVIIKVPVQ